MTLFKWTLTFSISNLSKALFNIVFEITSRMLMISKFESYPEHFLNNFEQKLNNNKKIMGFLFVNFTKKFLKIIRNKLKITKLI